MIYVIDHNDSFTHNVVHQFSLFDEVECDNYNEIDKKKLQRARVIVFSPGPGNPRNYPTTSKIYKQFKGKKKRQRKKHPRSLQPHPSCPGMKYPVPGNRSLRSI